MLKSTTFADFKDTYDHSRMDFEMLDVDDDTRQVYVRRYLPCNAVLLATLRHRSKSMIKPRKLALRGRYVLIKAHCSMRLACRGAIYSDISLNVDVWDETSCNNKPKCSIQEHGAHRVAVASSW